MKVLIIIDSLITGGKERRLVEFLKNISNRSDIICELVLRSKIIDYSEVFNLGIHIHYLIGNKKRIFGIFLELYDICKKFNPDIIHSWESVSSLYAFPIAKLLGKKFVNAMITNAPDRLKLSNKNKIYAMITFPFSEFIISNSFAGLKSYKSPKNKSYCIHNGFNYNRITNIIDKTKMREKIGINNEIVVGMVACFVQRKDYETFILAAQKILSCRDDIIFLAIGDGETLDFCKSLVQSEHRDKIRFLGRQEDIESIINVFDIGILTTNEKIHGEGIPNSIMEYMALGKPVIATDNGGTNEIVINNKTGYLVPSHSTEILSEKIEYLLDNPAISKKMGDAGKKRIETEFSMESNITKTINIYKLAMNNRC